MTACFIFMSKPLFILFLLIFFSIYLAFNPYYIKLNSNVKEEQIDSTVTVSFSFVGDIMCHSTQYNYARVNKDSFDFNPVFSVIKNYLKEKDILIGNLETVLAGNSKKYSGYPYFNSPNEFADALKNTGFDFLSTANNHANDQGYDGVERTIKYLKFINIVPIGTKIKSDSSEVFNIFVRKGIRFGLLSYTFGTNYKENTYRVSEYVSIIDTNIIQEDLQRLKANSCDIIIVYFHFGDEYQSTISTYQEMIVNKTIEYGADFILGAHPHIIQPFEKFKSSNKKLDSGFVVYSLGNFISNQRWRYSDGGVIFNFYVTKNIFTDSLSLSKVTYLPIWVFKGETEKGKEYIILPANYYNNYSLFNFLSEDDRDNMKQSLIDTKILLTSKSNFPQLDSLKILD